MGSGILQILDPVDHIFGFVNRTQQCKETYSVTDAMLMLLAKYNTRMTFPSNR